MRGGVLAGGGRGAVGHRIDLGGRVQERDAAEGGDADCAEAEGGAQPLEDLLRHPAHELWELHGEGGPKTSPNAAASFVSLAQHGFYDSTPIFRITKGTSFAGGDPTGTGKGGPGYTTVDKVPDRRQVRVRRRGDGEAVGPAVRDGR